MERLIGRDKGNPYMLKCFENGCCEDMGSTKCHLCKHNNTIFEKLAHYKDLEEAGLLLTLPGKVGDTLYQVAYLPGGWQVHKRVIGDIKIGMDGDKHFLALEFPETNLACHRYQVAESLETDGFYLTPQEAEAALAAKKGDCNE